jgi:hypothetical protein
MPDAPDGPQRTRGGFTIPEYERRVWDMARHLVHPAAFYAVPVVAGGARLLGHPLLDDRGVGAAIEVALFLAAFLGAWACFYSTLLRDAGLPSRAVTVLVPLAWVVALVLWLAVPPPETLSARGFALAAAALAGPGPVAWLFTMARWRRHRREHAALLDESAR